MEVRSIGRQEFDRLYPYTGELTRFIGEGAEWFTDDSRSVVGIIVLPAAQPAWKYAVLKRSKLGDLQVWNVGEVNGDLQATRDECRRAMAAVESASEAGEKAGSVPQEGTLQHVEQPNKSPLVVLMILAGDIITVAFVLLWLIRCH